MGRILDKIIGHRQIIESLLRASQSHKLHTTFLFIGPNGIGKKMTAMALSQVLLCEKTDNACGECQTCRRVEKGESEGMLLISPEKNQIKIDQCRRINEWLSLKPITKSRIVIIDQAQCMNPQAANSLLKTLEEPPEGAYFFLIAPSGKHVLPTIRSRSQVVAFSPLAETEIKNRTEAPDWMIKACGGSFERLNNLQNSDAQEVRLDTQKFIEMWLGDTSNYLTPEWRELIKDKSAAMGISTQILSFIRDAMYFKNGSGEDLRNADKMNLVKELADLPFEKLSKLSELAVGLESALLAHRDSQLVFEEFWIKTKNEVTI